MTKSLSSPLSQGCQKLTYGAVALHLAVCGGDRSAPPILAEDLVATEDLVDSAVR
jgi:hypothetical protein